MLDLVESKRIRRLSGFGMTAIADGYVYMPTTSAEVVDAFGVARNCGRRVVLRGAGLSYGDAAILPEAIVIDISKMDRILSWDSESGIVVAEGGVTIEGLWRRCLPEGWWPPVVSGTMYPTLAGALAMNIHGKNAFRAGPLGEHVVELEAVTSDGRVLTMKREDPLFTQVISSAGLLAAIVRVTLQMKRVPSGDLRVLALSQPDWDAQFRAFEQLQGDADYLVSWVDCFGRGSGSGRGLIHAAWYTEGPKVTLNADHQDLPASTLGIPKSSAWRMLRLLNNRLGMRLLNALKHTSAKLMGNGKQHTQSLVAFNFLLDYVPNWKFAYLPDGFIQYQSFVPKEHAARVFRRQIEMQHEVALEAFLGVLKRHRPDDFMLSHSVDGYSLALDFKVTRRNRGAVWELCHRMNALVLESGGKFYFAKDSTLRPSDVEAFLGPDTLATFRAIKAELDPDALLDSALAQRLGLTGNEKGPAFAGPI